MYKYTVIMRNKVTDNYLPLFVGVVVNLHQETILNKNNLLVRNSTFNWQCFTFTWKLFHLFT